MATMSHQQVYNIKQMQEHVMYHNVCKLQDVVAKATKQTWSNYFNTRLRDKIGMDGAWFDSGNNSVYASTTRSMARFGY
jgi:CubicO group peptidase (beta-lactamase class C family)